MKFDNSFTVPIDTAEAWALLLDVPTIAPCMPGAEITQMDGPRKFRGRARVKIGPVALSFAGDAELVMIDEKAKAARLVARGNDTNGRGSASATLDFTLTPDTAGSRVTVTIDLNLVGAVAQYGRGAGLIKDIAGQLIGQFARNLESAIRAAAGEEGIAAPAGKPISGMRVLGGAFKSAMQRKFGGKAASQ
jgi:carbon monoxide dehydrogenase subunit G